jgi:hypothetical protein
MAEDMPNKLTIMKQAASCTRHSHRCENLKSDALLPVAQKYISLHRWIIVFRRKRQARASFVTMAIFCISNKIFPLVYFNSMQSTSPEDGIDSCCEEIPRHLRVYNRKVHHYFYKSPKSLPLDLILS